MFFLSAKKIFLFDQNINVEDFALNSNNVAVANAFLVVAKEFANGLLMTSKRASKCSWLLQMTNGFAHGKCSWLLMDNFALVTTMKYELHVKRAETWKKSSYL